MLLGVRLDLPMPVANTLKRNQKQLQRKRMMGVLVSNQGMSLLLVGITKYNLYFVIFRQVLEVVAELHNLSVDDVAQQIFQNTFNIFG